MSRDSREIGFLDLMVGLFHENCRNLCRTEKNIDQLLNFIGVLKGKAFRYLSREIQDASRETAIVLGPMSRRYIERFLAPPQYFLAFESLKKTERSLSYQLIEKWLLLRKSSPAHSIDHIMNFTNEERRLEFQQLTWSNLSDKTNEWIAALEGPLKTIQRKSDEERRNLRSFEKRKCCGIRIFLSACIMMGLAVIIGIYLASLQLNLSDSSWVLNQMGADLANKTVAYYYAALSGDQRAIQDAKAWAAQLYRAPVNEVFYVQPSSAEWFWFPYVSPIPILFTVKGAMAVLFSVPAYEGYGDENPNIIDAAKAILWLKDGRGWMGKNPYMYYDGCDNYHYYHKWVDCTSQEQLGFPARGLTLSAQVYGFDDPVEPRFLQGEYRDCPKDMEEGIKNQNINSTCVHYMQNQSPEELTYRAMALAGFQPNVPPTAGWIFVALLMMGSIAQFSTFYCFWSPCPRDRYESDESRRVNKHKLLVNRSKKIYKFLLGTESQRSEGDNVPPSKKPGSRIFPVERRYLLDELKQEVPNYGSTPNIV